jgi:hypothetical protein
MKKDVKVHFCYFDSKELRIFEAALPCENKLPVAGILPALLLLFKGTAQLHGLDNAEGLQQSDLKVYSAELKASSDRELTEVSSNDALLVLIGVKKHEAPMFVNQVRKRINNGELKYDIFICHANTDQDVAFEILHYAESNRIRSWSYEKDAFPGISHLQQTLVAIQDSGCVILLLSVQSMESEFVLQEVLASIQFEKHIIPVLIGITHEEIERNYPKWSKFLGTRVSIQWNEGDRENVLKRIKQGVSRILESIS